MKRPEPRAPRGWGLLTGGAPQSSEERVALGLMLLLHLALVVALGLAALTLAKYWSALQLPQWQKVAFEVGIGVAIVSFAVRAVRIVRVDLVRCALGDEGLAADERGPGIRERLDHGALDGRGVVSVDVRHDVPAVALEALRRVVSEPALDVAVDGDAVVVVEADEPPEL